MNTPTEETGKTAEAKKAVAPKPPKKTEQSLRVKFTEEEVVKLARKLAEKNAEAEQADNDKKAVTKQLAAKCEGIAAQVSEISGKINAGFEYRTVQCETTYDDPKPGMKTTRRLDTLEVIEQEAMTLAELQQELPFHGTASGEVSVQVVPFASGRKPQGITTPHRMSRGGVVAVESDGEDIDDAEANTAGGAQ